MWLALDIGNSAVKGGFFEGDREHEVHHPFRLDLRPRLASADAWHDALADVPGGRSVERTGLVSVVPAATEAARTALRKLTGSEALLLHSGLALPFQLRYHAPESLGTDRLAAAAGAWAGFGGAGRPVIAIDAGTAITFDLISPAPPEADDPSQGIYEGGAIGAGPALLRQALCEGTAQLSEVPLRLPDSPVGRSTAEALQSGLMNGFIDSARGMIRRFSQEVDGPPVVTATGGWSALLERHLPALDHRIPHLVLRGIHELMVLNEG